MNLIHKTDFITDDCVRDCHNRFFHTFEYECVYDIKLTNVGNHEVVKITIAYKNMILYESKKIENCSKKWFYI